MIANYFKPAFLWIPPFIGMLAAEVLIHQRAKREREMKLVEELKKLNDEFTKFTYGSYTISLPCVIQELFADKSFVDATKNIEKTVKPWKYHFDDLRYDLSEKSSTTKEILDKHNHVTGLTDILRAFTDLISLHYKLHRRFKEMCNDFNFLPSTYLERYNKGVKEYNELFRMLKKSVLDYKDITISWFEGKYFFDFIEELKPR